MDRLGLTVCAFSLLRVALPNSVCFFLYFMKPFCSVFFTYTSVPPNTHLYHPLPFSLHTGHQAGHDLNYLARAGVLGMLKKPAALPVQVADICAGSYPAVVQILAGLRRAEKTGKGSVIDVSMAGGSYALLAMAMAKHAATGEEVGAGKDWLSGEQPCYRVYPTKDGHISVGALEPKFWLPLVKVINKPHLADKQFASGQEGEVVLKELEATFSSRTNTEWKEIFNGHDCCVEIGTLFAVVIVACFVLDFLPVVVSLSLSTLTQCVFLAHPKPIFMYMYNKQKITAHQWHPQKKR